MIPRRLALVELQDTHDPRDLPPEILKTTCVFMFDEAEHTYCAEITASHWLEALYRNVYFRDDVTDERKEELQEEWGQVSQEDSHYCWAHEVKAQHYADHSKDSPDETPEEVWESWRESWQGNCPL